MKKFFTLILLVISAYSYAQNVGINATGAAPDNSAGLDVNFTNRGFLPPRVALTGITDGVTIANPATGLLVYNTSNTGVLTPGYYFNRGTPASPVWVPFSKTITYHSSATAGVTITTNGAVTLIPGTPITVVVPTGMIADIDIYAYVGARFAPGSIGTDVALCDLLIYRNGAFIPIGGWNRVRIANNGLTTGEMVNMAIISRDVGLTSGTYTYDLRGNRFSGTWGVVIGGNCSSQVNCGEMTIVVNFR